MIDDGGCYVRGDNLIISIDEGQTYFVFEVELNFKNPFDLIEEEEEPMSMPSHRHPYVPPTNNVHAPLPFHPYEITKEEPAKPAKTMPKQPFVNEANKTDNSPTFSSPFPEDERYENAPTPAYPNNNYQAEPKIQK